MKKSIVATAVGILTGLVILGILLLLRPHDPAGRASLLPVQPQSELPLPLQKYTVENLAARTFAGDEITLDEAVATAAAYTVFRFHYRSDGNLVTGLAHIPNEGNPPFPVVMQLRGYVDREIYQPGVGTKRSAEVFAANGFISLAPDFLGYGQSDMPSTDVFEERFQTHTAALNLLASIPNWSLAAPGKIGIWGHSNGGQIALTILEISGRPYPTTLWAPVTKPFPYSILYYTDEFSDRGKMLRRLLAGFEEHYDVELYSMPNYVSRITAPIQLHQGTTDDAVPLAWSDAFVEQLHDEGKEIRYYVYPGADHNMSGSWDTVVRRDIQFFRDRLLQ